MLKQKINKWLYEKSIHFMRRQAKVEAHAMEVNGYSIAYLESKNSYKNTIIFIHGCNGSKDDWLTLAKALNTQYHLILIDFLGAGDSSKDLTFDYSLRSQASLLEMIIRQITTQKDIHQYSLCGTSSGGALAILLANRLPIDKLILLNSLGIQVKESKIDILAKEAGCVNALPWLNIRTKYEMKEMMKISFYKAPKIPNFILEYFLDKQSKDRELSTHKFSYFFDKEMNLIDDLTEDAKHIKQKTLIIWGKEDNNINVASAYRADELIMHSTLKVYEECGHVIPIEQPNKVIKDITLFLNSSNKE